MIVRQETNILNCQHAIQYFVGEIYIPVNKNLFTECLLLDVQQQIFHAYSGQEQIQQCMEMRVKWDN